jgi:hypothetical protein
MRRAENFKNLPRMNTDETHHEKIASEIRDHPRKSAVKTCLLLIRVYLW